MAVQIQNRTQNIVNQSPLIHVSDEEYGEKSVSVLLDGEESELVFIDMPDGEMSVSHSLKRRVVCESLTNTESCLPVTH